MPAAPQEAIDRGLETFLALVRENPALDAEFEHSRAEFYPAGPPSGDAREILLAGRRHVEWFVLERISRTLRGSPVELLLPAWRTRSSEDPEREEHALLNCFTGIFVVTGLQDTSGMWLRDIVGFGEYLVSDPEGAGHRREGDMIVGRLFPTGDELHHLSRAAAFFRDDTLREAVTRDIETLREARGHGRVFHVSQLELERMFFAGERATGSNDPLADPIGRARELLIASGVGEWRIDELFATLARAPFDTELLVHGAGDELAEILDELAFDTDIDLLDARRIFALAWERLASPTEDAEAAEDLGVGAEDTRAAADDTRAAVEAFEQGRRARGDLGALIANLASDLELGPVDDPDEEDSPAPDFPGVVGAMVEEFLWEVGAERGADERARLAPLSKLGRFAREIGNFESFGAPDLLRFTTFWLHEERELVSEEEARALVDALQGFCTWAEEAHGVPLHAEFGPTLATLRESLPPIAAANDLIPRPAKDEVGELFEVRDELPDGARLLLDSEGNEHSAYLDPQLARRLPRGARLRGRIQQDRRAVVFCCYPPEAAGLVGQRGASGG